MSMLGVKCSKCNEYLESRLKDGDLIAKPCANGCTNEIADYEAKDEPLLSPDDLKLLFMHLNDKNIQLAFDEAIFIPNFPDDAYETLKKLAKKYGDNNFMTYGLSKGIQKIVDELGYKFSITEEIQWIPK